MAGADPLTLAVREHAAWFDLVCRLHRFTPEGDGRLWWSARRTPDLVPDAVTLVPDASVLDVLGRINDSSGASVEDSFATLDLTDQGWTLHLDATWVARPPGSGGDDEVASTFAVVREKFPFAAWCRARGAPEGVLPSGLRRAPGVTVLGRQGDGGFVDGVIVHRTEIGGTPVAGLWNAFGSWADIADALSHRHPEAWIVGYERGARLDAAFAAGFTAIGPLRVWNR
jgi:hypothetical protein